VAVIGGCVERESPQEWTLPHHQAELTNDGRSKRPPPYGPWAAVAWLNPLPAKVFLGGCVG
jgi:hypothetical protein